MSEERKGALNPEQEKILEQIIKLKSPVAESVDGIAIQLIDNLAIERLLDEADKANTEIRQYVYQVVDMIFKGIGEITK